jgi:hypothetical protein
MSSQRHSGESTPAQASAIRSELESVRANVRAARAEDVT